MENNLREIAKKWLEQNGFDGLFNSGVECGCEICDLMCCDEPSMDCEAGYKVACDETCEHEKADWHIQREKPKER